MYCTTCGKELIDGASVCHHCGFKEGEGYKYCSHCGVAVECGQTLCVSCGFMLTSAELLNELSDEEKLKKAINTNIKNMKIESGKQKFFLFPFKYYQFFLSLH